MPPTFKARLFASETDTTVLANVLTEMLDPPPAVCINEADGARMIEVYFPEAPDPARLAEIAGMFPNCRQLKDMRLTPLPDEDWVAEVQRGLHPVRAGRFFIHGSHDRTAAAGRGYAIEIDAGQAFGTAHHGTTRGCLLALDALAKRERIESTLDLGTGSGVLAIAAAKALHGEVLATDIDPVAVEVADGNFERNGVAAQIDAVVAGDLKHPAILLRSPYGLVMANILAKPVLTFAPHMPVLMARGGYIILSGLLRTQAREVTARYVAQGFTLKARFPLAEWTTLLLRWRGMR